MASQDLAVALPVEPVEAFPTQQSIQARARKAAGAEVKKKKQIVEQHFDDCGEDFSLLDADDPSVAATLLNEQEIDGDNFEYLVSWRFGVNGS